MNHTKSSRFNFLIIIILLGVSCFIGFKLLSRPKSPILKYNYIGNDQWEFKRLKVGDDGFKILDAGTVVRGNNKFQLNVTKTERAEHRPAYLEKTFWTDLNYQLTEAEKNGRNTLGFLEYYGFYYLVLHDKETAILVCLGETKSFNGTMSMNRFYRKVWTYYRHNKNKSGGLGL